MVMVVHVVLVIVMVVLVVIEMVRVCMLVHTGRRCPGRRTGSYAGNVSVPIICIRPRSRVISAECTRYGENDL